MSEKIARRAKVATPNLHLGYEAGSGNLVEIPLRHMAVTGQTQRSGKTTTLEGLISRANVTSLAFITKRGEGSFKDAHRTPVYFSDDAGGRPYWEFVESIVASTMGQKMKFERAWIVKAAKGAKSLEEVRQNLGTLMARARRSMDQDIYMLLAEYLDIVLPQMREHHFSKELLIRSSGLTVMDVTQFTEEMQMLIVRACLLNIHKHAHEVVTIVPEAWKFVPEGRMTPVKPAAERLVREGAALGNFVWIDSQDIAGVSKLLLRSATVWIIGVQREANEIKRTLANIPEGVKKPRAADVATLGIGEFFACFDSAIHRTYVQPAWLSDGEAYAVATGIKTVADLVYPADMRGAHMTEIGHWPKEESDMTKDEEKELRNENAVLKEQVRQLTDQLTAHHQERRPESVAVIGRPSAVPLSDGEYDRLYQAIKQRLANEAPQLLKVVMLRPEIEVSIKRETIKMDTDSIDGRVAVLIANGFFDDVKTPSATLTELQRRGWRSIHPRLSESFGRMTKRGFLYKEENGYRVVEETKVNILES